MTVVASIAIDAEEFVLGEALASTMTRIELTQFVPVGEQLVPYFWKEHDGDRQAFEQHVRKHPAVVDLDDLNGRVNASLYRIEWTDEINGLLDALRTHDILVEEAATSDGDTWIFRLRALGQEAFSALQTACYEQGIHLDIRRVQHNPTSVERDRTLVGVTPKQADALLLALEHGYFEVPREISATELAEEMGISRQAFSRRLQRGQQSIFTNLRSDLRHQ